MGFASPRCRPIDSLLPAIRVAAHQSMCMLRGEAMSMGSRARVMARAHNKNNGTKAWKKSIVLVESMLADLAITTD